MKKDKKEFIVIKELVKDSQKFNKPIRLRLRRKLNKNSDEMIKQEEKIEQMISEIPNKLYKNRNFKELEPCVNLRKQLLEIMDKSMDLIQFY